MHVCVCVCVCVCVKNNGILSDLWHMQKICMLHKTQIPLKCITFIQNNFSKYGEYPKNERKIIRHYGILLVIFECIFNRTDH